jgi:fermentation-respiration switch protein FrsA (DUF1100 family)
MTKNHVGFAVLALVSVTLTAGCRTVSPVGQSSPSPTCSPPAEDQRPAQPATSPSSASLNPLSGVERSLIFVPTPYPKGNWRPDGLKFEDAWFSASDGTRLHGWYVAHERPRAVVLFCHGNAGNVAQWADELRILHDRLGVSSLLFDYRGFGRSEGKPSEAGVLADARAARAWLARRAGVAESQIVLMGRSLGGAVAVDLAATDGARALVLESTFTSMPDVAKTMFPLLPVRLLMQTQLNSVAKIGRYHGPLLQSHGTADRLIPYAIGRRLFDAANEPKQFVPIPGGDHNDSQTDDYYVALSAFFDRLK